VSLEQSAQVLPRRSTSRDQLRLSDPTGLNWALLAYAALTVAVGWAYVVSRIHADYVNGYPLYVAAGQSRSSSN
jgi:hypothetical protein